MPNPMEWEVALRKLESLRNELFMLTAPTQPLTAIETVRHEFRQLVTVSASAPSPQAAMKVHDVATQLINLAKQTPGFELPSDAFAKLKAEIEAGCKTIEAIIKAQQPPEIDRDREEAKRLWLDMLGSREVPDAIDHIEEMFLAGPMDATKFATCSDRVRALIIEVCRQVAKRVGILTGKDYRGDWDNEHAVWDYLSKKDVGFLTNQEKGLVVSVYGLTSDHGAHRLIGEREYARIAKNISFELLLLLLEKLEKMLTAREQSTA